MVLSADYARNVQTHYLLSVDQNHAGDINYFNLAGANAAITATNSFLVASPGLLASSVPSAQEQRWGATPWPHQYQVITGYQVIPAWSHAPILAELPEPDALASCLSLNLRDATAAARDGMDVVAGRASVAVHGAARQCQERRRMTAGQTESLSTEGVRSLEVRWISRGELAGVVWHEEHRGGNFPREDLRIVSRGARHRHRATRRAMIRSAPQFILKGTRHQDRIDLPDAFENDFAGTRLIGLGDQFIQRVFKTLELRDLDVADLKQHLSAARHDAGLAWLEADCACGPDASRAGDFGKSRSDRAAQLDERDAGVPTYRHPGRTRVVLLAGEGDAILPDADDARDDPKMQAGLVEIIALLDMGFEIADVIFRRDRLTLLRR